MTVKSTNKGAKQKVKKDRLLWNYWTSIGDFCRDALSPALARQLKSLVEAREQGVLPEQDFFRKVMEVVQLEDAKRTQSLKVRLNRMFGLGAAMTDHFLARLIARHYHDVAAFVMESVRCAVRRARKSGVSKVFLDDMAVVFDPRENTLISIYPKVSLRGGR